MWIWKLGDQVERRMKLVAKGWLVKMEKLAKSSNLRIQNSLNMFWQLFYNKRLSQMLNSLGIWEKLARRQGESSAIFDRYEDDHQIKKLKLSNLNLTDVKEKVQSLQLKINGSSKNWMENQYRVYMWLILMLADIFNLHPFHFDQTIWNFIAETFKKPVLDCRYFYQCCCKSKTSDWTPEEDQQISQLMKNPKLSKKWTDIGLQLFQVSNEIFFRKPKAIRQRWLSHINPDIIKKDWTLEEDLILFEKTLEIGKKWAKISKHLGNKSQHSVKNRYKKVLHLKCKQNQLLEQELQQDTESKLITTHKEEVERKLKDSDCRKETSLFPLLKIPKKRDEKTDENLTKNQIKGYYFQPIILTTSNSN